MTDLSPAAQAVFNAAWTCPIVLGDHPVTRSRQIAAALRAAADQVVPQEAEPLWWQPVRPSFNRQRLRRQLLAIAAELEAQ